MPRAEFAAFYAPDEGLVWSFYDEFLKRRIRRRGDNFEFATGLGMPASRVLTSTSGYDRRRALRDVGETGGPTNPEAIGVARRTAESELDLDWRFSIF